MNAENSAEYDATVAVLKDHAGVDYADDMYYCLGCLETLGIAMGVETRWAEHVADELAKAVVERKRATKAAKPAAAESCTQCEGGQSRCVYYACRERQDDRHDRWWCEFGACSHAHAVLHYGEEAI